MKLLFILLCLSTSLTSFGQTIIHGSINKKIELNESPSFFFKVRGDSSMIAYTVPTPGRRAIEPGINKIINLTTGKITEIPGPHDPVFIGDLDLIIIPALSPRIYEIFSISGLLNLNDYPIGKVKRLNGFYQSAGILNQNDEFATVRVIAERNARYHSVVDFRYYFSGKLVIDDTKERILCPTTNFKLPMLSKDGKYVGGLDIDTNTSGVWKILDNYECTKVADLGRKTGKLNFNFDNSKLTYHIYKKIGEVDSDSSDNYVPLPEETNVADIYTFDMKSSTHTQITKNSSSNSLYPDFTRDGSLVFVNHPHGNEKVSFVFLELGF